MEYRDAFLASVSKAVKMHGGLGGDLLRRYARLVEDVPASYPLEPVALMSAEVIQDPAQRIAPNQIFGRVLAVQGYGPDAARKIRDQLFDMYPEMIPETTMLAPREVLVEQYGHVYGTMLAQALADPSSQPILYELLFGAGREIPDPECIGIPTMAMEHKVIQRTCCVALFEFDSSRNGWLLRDQSPPLSPYEADHMFRRYTGYSNLRLSVAILPQIAIHDYCPHR